MYGRIQILDSINWKYNISDFGIRNMHFRNFKIRKTGFIGLSILKNFRNRTFSSGGFTPPPQYLPKNHGLTHILHRYNIITVYIDRYCSCVCICVQPIGAYKIIHRYYAEKKKKTSTKKKKNRTATNKNKGGSLWEGVKRVFVFVFCNGRSSVRLVPFRDAGDYIRDRAFRTRTPVRVRDLHNRQHTQIHRHTLSCILAPFWRALADT